MTLVRSDRGRAARVAMVCLAVLACVGFIALGTWQLQRLGWKQDLIARAEQRVDAAPVPPPARQRWGQVTAQSDEYRHVVVSGTLLHELSVRVQAVTDFGAGFWLVTPLRLGDQTIVLVNRGFVLVGPVRQTGATVLRQAHCTADDSAPLQAKVSGLLRISEPNGAFLRHNDPFTGHWYSRDVVAIASQEKLTAVAPYFIDADGDPQVRQPSDNCPVGGLTVVAFQNNHLVYAVTWYALALIVAAGLFWGRREKR